MKTLTSAFKKLIRLTKQNVIITKSIYVGGHCHNVVQQRKGTVRVEAFWGLNTSQKISRIKVLKKCHFDKGHSYGKDLEQ